MSYVLDGHVVVADCQARWNEEGPEIYRRITERAYRMVASRISQEWVYYVSFDALFVASNGLPPSGGWALNAWMVPGAAAGSGAATFRKDHQSCAG
jgi:hypothetical protein